MGGEPLINPEIKEWLVGMNQLMPDTTIRFPTNGTLLHKQLDIIDLMAELGNVILKITVHVDDSVVEKMIDYVMSRFAWEEIQDFGIQRWVTKNNFKFQVNRPTRFFKVFRNSYTNAMPYNNAPDRAFEICHQKTCPLLIDDRIYKCSTSGLMPGVLKRFNNPNTEHWEKYIDIAKNGSIGLDATDIEIQKFIDNIGKPHATCSQCPDASSTAEIDHRATVFFRNKSKQ
jgi:hypothetical protein